MPWRQHLREGVCDSSSVCPHRKFDAASKSLDLFMLHMVCSIWNVITSLRANFGLPPALSNVAFHIIIDNICFYCKRKDITIGWRHRYAQEGLAHKPSVGFFNLTDVSESFYLDIFISSNGSDTNAGTISSPFLTFQKVCAPRLVDQKPFSAAFCAPIWIRPVPLKSHTRISTFYTWNLCSHRSWRAQCFSGSFLTCPSLFPV